MEEHYIEACTCLMERWHWSYQNVMDCPLPTFFVLFKELDKIVKKQEKELKKSKRKKR